MDNPIKDTIKILAFMVVSPLYLVCDIFGGLD